MTHEEAIAKVAKLLRLAQSDNPNEAAIAAARAQEIMDRYKLEGITADSDKPQAEPEEPIKAFNDPIEAKQGSTWVVRLIVALADVNQCKCFKSGSATHIIGRPSDAQTVRYLYGWLKAEVNRLAVVHGRGEGNVWKNNFRLGVVDTIARKLHEQQEATKRAVKAEAANPGAIVKVENAIAKLEARSQAVKVWAQQNMKFRPGRAVPGGQSDYGAREAGRKAGESINLTSQAKGALGSPSKQLKQ